MHVRQTDGDTEFPQAWSSFVTDALDPSDCGPVHMGDLTSLSPHLTLCLGKAGLMAPILTNLPKLKLLKTF